MLAAIRPCCDPATTNIFSAIFSDTCDYCSSTDYTAQQQQLSTFGNSGNGVPNCDPNAGTLENVFSNSCNVTVPDVISSSLGLPTGVPAWIYWIGAGLVGVVILKGIR